MPVRARSADRASVRASVREAMRIGGSPFVAHLLCGGRRAGSYESRNAIAARTDTMDMRVQRSRLGVDDLYCRGVDTLSASWAAYASGVRGARTLQAPGVAAAIFPTEPERGVY